MYSLIEMAKLSGKELYDQAIIFKQNLNYDNFIIYITMAANYDYHLAIYNIYKCNTYMLQNYSITLQFYEETVYGDDKNSYSIHFLAFMYYNGYGVSRNNEKSLKLYEIAVRKGNYQSLINLHIMFKHDMHINFKNIMEIYVSAIENDDVSAYYKLAYMYIKGVGVEKNIIKAVTLYETAISKGDTLSLVLLATIYRHGYREINQNYEKTIKLYELAIEKGYDETLILLAFMYQEGLGVSKNYAKAIELYETAIKKGIKTSLLQLITICCELNNYNKILELYELPIAKNNRWVNLFIIEKFNIKTDTEVSLT